MAIVITSSNSLFTPPTRTRQNCLVLSCPCRQCEHNWRQDNTVLSCLDPVSNLQLFSLIYVEDYWKLGNWRLGQGETKLIKTALSCLQLCSHRLRGQDKTVLSCPCRRCEQAIKRHIPVKLSSRRKPFYSKPTTFAFWFVPETEHRADDSSVDVIEVIATHSSPDTGDFDLQTTFVIRPTSGQSYICTSKFIPSCCTFVATAINPLPPVPLRLFIYIRLLCIALTKDCNWIYKAWNTTRSC